MNDEEELALMRSRKDEACASEEYTEQDGQAKVYLFASRERIHTFTSIDGHFEYCTVA